MALCTEAQCRERIPQLAGAPGGDTGLLDLIDSVSAACARWCGWPSATSGAAPTLESTTYTLYVGDHHGAVIVEGRELWLPVRAVSSVTTIYDDPDQAYTASTALVASTDYTLDSVLGRVRLLPTGTRGSWSDNPYDVRVVCVAGFATGAIPSEVEAAAVEAVAHQYALGAQGAASESPSLLDIALPLRTRQLLAPYRVGHYAAAGASGR